MKPALPTASVTYGLNEPSATATVDNATPAGLHLSTRKFCPNKRVRLYSGEIAMYQHGAYNDPKANPVLLRRQYVKLAYAALT